MRVKLMYPPRLYGVRKVGHPHVHHHIIPLSLPTLVSYLRNQGFHADQDDLDIRCFQQWFNRSRKAPDLVPFAEKERILAALDNADDKLLREAEKCLRMTRTRGYDVIGFSVTDEFNMGEIGTAVLMAKILREKHDPFIIVSGTGIHTNLNQDLLNASPDIDAVMKGPHFNAYNLLTLIENGQLPPDDEGYKQQKIKPASLLKHHAYLARGRGFWSRFRGRNAARASPRTLKSCNPKDHTIDEHLPMPCFDGLPLDLYRFTPDDMPGGKKMLLLPYKYLYGCQSNCAFCYLSGTGFHALKSPEVIAEELEYLSGKHNTTNFYFTNANCNPSKGFVKELAQEFAELDLNLRWTDCANLMALDRETLHHLKDAGAVRLIYGLESASDRMLRYVGKPLTLARAEKLLRISHGLGIWNEVEIIAGMPCERYKDLQSTERFLRRNSDVIDYFYLNMFHLSDLSLMYYQPERYGITNLREDPNGVGCAFDEIGGLSWKDSLEQRKGFFKHILSLRRELFDFGYFGMEDSFLKLFYLSVMHGDKHIVRERLKQAPSIYGRLRTDGEELPPEFLYYRLPDEPGEKGVVEAR